MRSSGGNLVTIGIIVPPFQPSAQHEGGCPGDRQGTGAACHGALGFPGAFGVGDGAGEAAWPVWRESSSAPKKEVAVALPRQKVSLPLKVGS